MKIDSDKIVTMTQANQNFSRVAKKVNSLGEVVVFKNNKPIYVLAKADEYFDKKETNERQ